MVPRVAAGTYNVLNVDQLGSSFRGYSVILYDGMGLPTSIAATMAPLQSQFELYQYMLGDGAVLGSSLYVNIVLAGFSILGFVYMTRNLQDPRAKLIAVATIMVPVVSISSYSGLASGLTMDVLQMPAAHPLSDATVTIAGTEYNGVVTMWGRYLTWAFSTPFILMALGLLAGSNFTKIFTAIVFDIAMCITGLAAALTTSTFNFRWWWYILSTSFFLVVIYIILVEWPRDAKATGTLGPIFNTLKILTVIMWFGYPVFWAAGAEGAGGLSAGVTSWAYSALDIIAKYLFAFLLLNYLRDEPDAITADDSYGASLPSVTPADD